MTSAVLLTSANKFNEFMKNLSLDKYFDSLVHSDGVFDVHESISIYTISELFFEITISGTISLHSIGSNC